MTIKTLLPSGAVWQPPSELVEASNILAFLRNVGVEDYDSLVARADADPQWFWGAVVDLLQFYKPYKKLLEQDGGLPFSKWCVGGTSNIVLNCLDRHRPTSTWQREVLIWGNEAGATVRWTYEDLDREVCLLAHGMQKLGIRQGEVVGLFLPNIPHALVAFLACAKIGVIAMPLFSGFGSNALADRLQSAGAVALITADGTSRRTTQVSMKAVADEAILNLPALRHLIVVKNVGITVAWDAKRDHWLHELVHGCDEHFPTVELPADATLMLMYTSGTTGKPKGTVHTHIGFAAKMRLDVGLIMDLKSSDRLMWMSDMGWLVGPMVAVAVPLHGATLVMAEGSPDYPDRGRMWRLIDEHAVTLLGIAPTTARSFIKNGGGDIEKYRLSSLRICVSTGEVWTPDAWQWTFEQVCKARVPLLNYSGGTEVGGGILCGTVMHAIKPCTFSRAIPGMNARVVDDQGKNVSRGVVGELVLAGASPGLTKGLWQDEANYLKSYWTDIPGMWRHGDWATVDVDGYWTILGRSDDTLKIAGKRTGPSEIEALLASTGLVVESAVVGLPDPVKGQCVVCVVTLMPGYVLDDQVISQLTAAVVSGLGNPFRPKTIVAVDELPKTRNMKIMRRVVRAACLGQDPGDLSSLVNPESVNLLREKVGAQ
ncbi:MAG: AMP-binding protein [Pseudomonadota bacterium]